MKWVWRSLLGLLLLVSLGLGAGYFWLRGGLPMAQGTLQIDGLEAPVQIMRDSNAVPHIFAANDEDAYFALGFVHASDRLLQMEMQRIVAAGRLAELIGESGLRLDRFMRVLAVYRNTQATYRNLPDDVRQAVDAYTAGINAWLAQADVLPPAFYMLRHRPEPWLPADSMVWGRLIALQLSGNFRSEILRARMAEALTEEQTADLFPALGAPPTTLASALPGAFYGRLAAALPAPLGPSVASNEWVVSGALTDSGRPILANDPHLGLNTPSLWYLARIETPTLSVAGATVPGVPLVLLGHNEAVAWGVTTTGADTQDLFIERIDPDDPDRYLTPTGSEPFVVREEEIKIGRGGDSETLVVRETRHGPVLSGLDEDLEEEFAEMLGEGHVLALAYTGYSEEDTGAEAMFRLNRAVSLADALEAMRLYRSPVQNMVLADAQGAIGFLVIGDVPIRAKGDGSMPVPGWTGEYDWTGTVPFAEMPQAVDPEHGYFVNANNLAVPTDGDVFLGYGYEEPYRAERITELLETSPAITADRTAEIMLDTVSLAARALLPVMLEVRVETPRDANALAMLRRWDFSMQRDRPEPLVFIAWFRELNRALYADELGPDLFAEYWRLRPTTVRHMLTDAIAWCDNVETDSSETCQDILHDTLAAVLDGLTDEYGEDMETWRWGDAHIAYLTHRVYGRIPLIGGWFSHAAETDGGDFTVHRGAMSTWSESLPFAHVHGAGYRAIYTLDDLSRSRFILSTGQSGHPFSPHFGDMVERWQNGEWIEMSSSPEALADNGLGSLTLRPMD